MTLHTSIQSWLSRKRPARVLRATGVLLSLWAVVQSGPVAAAPRIDCRRDVVHSRVACKGCERATHPAGTPATRPCCQVTGAAPTAALPQSVSVDAGRDDARHMTALATLPALAVSPASAGLVATPVTTTSSPPLALAATGTTILRL